MAKIKFDNIKELHLSITPTIQSTTASEQKEAGSFVNVL